MHPIFDSEKALARIEGDKPFLIELIDAFVEDSQKQLRDIDTAIDERDADTVRRAAHTIKGSADVLFASITLDAARTLEQHGREARWDEIAEATATLREALTQLLPELREIAQS